MLINEHIFILGIAKYDGPFESTSFTVAKFLALKNAVYYIDYPYTWKDYYLKKDEAFKKRKGYFSSKSDGVLETDIENLKIIIVPPLLSINFLPEGRLYRFLLRFNEKIIHKRLRRLIKAFKIKEYIFINSFNFHYPGLSSLLKPKLTVYHCVDPLIIDHDTRHGITSENLIVKESDLVICTSKQLWKEKRLLNENVFFIPNAAEVSHSAKAQDFELKVHTSLDHIKKPIIGYFGNIERRIDYQLMEEVIRMNEDLNFVFAGPVVEEFVPASFRQLVNIYFIGRVPYEEMPAVLKGFDVAIIPFKKDKVSQTIFPLKLFEYLGTGKPVVATDFNLDLREFTLDTVCYCEKSSEFSAEIRRSLNQDTSVKKEKRISIAIDNSWTKRLTQISELIYTYLDRKSFKNK